jgi:hypothetical protein
LLWHGRRARAIDAQRALNVLQALLADVGKLGLDLAAHLAKGVLRDADAAGFSDTFEPRGNVDAVTEDIVALHQHVTEVDADAPVHSAIVCNPGTALRRQLLQRDRALEGADHRAKLDQDTIAGSLDDASAMLGHERISGSMVLAECPRRASLIRTHQTAIAGHIGGQDRGKAALDGLLHGVPRFDEHSRNAAGGTEERAKVQLSPTIADADPGENPNGWEGVGLPLCYVRV